MTIIAPFTTNRKQQSSGLDVGRATARVTPAESIDELLETASLYLHIPFCHTRCYYCDFNTYAGILPLREPYVRALLTEVALAGEGARQDDGSLRRARTIFFGGGTPSLLTVTQVQRLLDACRAG